MRVGTPCFYTRYVLCPHSHRYTCTRYRTTVNCSLGYKEQLDDPHPINESKSFSHFHGYEKTSGFRRAAHIRHLMSPTPPSPRNFAVSIKNIQKKSQFGKKFWRKCFSYSSIMQLQVGTAESMCYVSLVRLKEFLQTRPLQYLLLFSWLVG